MAQLAACDTLEDLVHRLLAVLQRYAAARRAHAAAAAAGAGGSVARDAARALRQVSE
jgi:hypothetical protein